MESAIKQTLVLNWSQVLLMNLAGVQQAADAEK